MKLLLCIVLYALVHTAAFAETKVFLIRGGDSPAGVGYHVNIGVGGRAARAQIYLAGNEAMAGPVYVAPGEASFGVRVYDWNHVFREDIDTVPVTLDAGCTYYIQCNDPAVTGSSDSYLNFVFHRTPTAYPSSEDLLETFLKGFFLVIAWELTGFIIRIVRKSVAHSPSI